MPYEIDFHPVGAGESSGDAITMRYHDGAQWRVLVIDAGYQTTGEAIVEHVRQVYETTIVDHAVSTHPDNDHIGGLASVLSELTVRNLWMHVPFLHAESMMRYFLSSRWTVEGLRRRLRESYPAISNLVNLAQMQGTQLSGPFTGKRIGPFEVLSPTVSLYEGLLPQFHDTPRRIGTFSC